MSESVNIRDGRRTVHAEPDWYPRPDGTERAVVFQPGFNSAPTGDPSTEYGVHGMEITWHLRGPKGAVWLRVYTEWIPGELSPGHGLSPDGSSRPAAQFPMGAGLGYCARIAQWEGQELSGAGDCPVIGGGPCYSDLSYSGADSAVVQFTEHGEPAIWAALESRYADLAVPGA